MQNWLVIVGYSSSNYLIQPKVQASPGTGDFSVTFWIKPGTLNVGTGNYVHVFSLGTADKVGKVVVLDLLLK